MKIRLSLELRINREPKQTTDDEEPPYVADGNHAQIETAPEHYPLGFTPSHVEAHTPPPY